MNYTMENEDAAQANRNLRSHLAGDHPNWEFVKMQLRKLPVSTELSTRGCTDEDPMGRSLLLGILTKDPPIDVVNETMRAFPDALVVNVSAYFLASRCNDLNVIRSIIRICVAMADPGICPYPWISMSHVSVGAAKVIIEEYPEGVLQKCIGSKHSLLDRELFSVENFRDCQPKPCWWEKLVLMLRAAEHGTIEATPSSCHPIHTALRRALMNPDFFKNQKVTQRVVWLMHQLRLKDPTLFRQTDQNGDLPLHVALRATCTAGSGFAQTKDLIAVLVDAHAESARTKTAEGRLPIHLGLENGWPCHDVLLQVAPDCLQSKDPKTGLYPFQLAACAKTWDKKRKRTQGLDTTYALLRKDPLQARPLQARGLLEKTSTP